MYPVSAKIKSAQRAALYTDHIVINIGDGGSSGEVQGQKSERMKDKEVITDVSN